MTNDDRINIAIAMIDEPGSTALADVLAERAAPGRSSQLVRAGLIDDLVGGKPIPEARLDHSRWWRERIDMKRVDYVARLMEQRGIWSIGPHDEAWPDWADDLGNAVPRVLFGMGDASLLSGPAVSVVGARAATSYGEHVTNEIVGGISDRGRVIVSGGAYGIDGAAHRQALSCWGGRTVAFLAGGLDRFYPAGHDELLTRIAETGLIVSEVEPGATPTKWRFLQRNRLIAARSQGTLVVEAGMRSGSLNTAGHTLRLGRTVMAVPGPITSPASSGTNHLIRIGDAIAVTSAVEVIETMED